MARDVSKKRVSSRRVNHTKLIVIVVGLIITVLAVLFGQTDDGQINVSEVTNNSNVAARENIENGDATVVPVVDSRPNQLNGGLVGSGKSEPVTPPEPVSESASTTNETATSTEETTEASEVKNE